MKPLVIGLLVLALAGCAAPEDRSAPADVDTAALVTERYGDCLEALNATEPTASGDTVTATTEGAILQWNVVVGNNGDVLTFPDEATFTELEKVGC